MASNAVECVLGKSEKVRRWKKRGKRKTNKDEKRGWHPNMQQSVFSSLLNSQTHEVEVLDTLHSQMLCVLDENKRQVKDKGKKTEWLVWL